MRWRDYPRFSATQQDWRTTCAVAYLAIERARELAAVGPACGNLAASSGLPRLDLTDTASSPPKFPPERSHPASGQCFTGTERIPACLSPLPQPTYSDSDTTKAFIDSSAFLASRSWAWASSNNARRMPSRVSKASSAISISIPRGAARSEAYALFAGPPAREVFLRIGPAALVRTVDATNRAEFMLFVCHGAF